MAKKNQPEIDVPFDDDILPQGDIVSETGTESEVDAWSQGLKETENPIGKFTAILSKAELGRSKSSGNLQITWVLTIEDPGGDYDGREIRKYDGLNSPQRAAITQQGLKRLGINPGAVSISTLPDELEKLVGRRVSIETREHGQYYNIYFQRLLPADGESSVDGF